MQISIGGAGKEAGLRQMASNFVLRFAAIFRLLFIDTDKKDVEQLPKWMKFLMNDFPASAFLDQLEANPDEIPGSGLTDRIAQYRQGLGGSESITAGLQTFRQLGWPLLTFYLCRYAAEFFYFLLARSKSCTPLPPIAALAAAKAIFRTGCALLSPWSLALRWDWLQSWPADSQSTPLSVASSRWLQPL
ncbi:MAG: hypothetical protein R2932_19725 [Caldilineaceae bacterium]